MVYDDGNTSKWYQYEENQITATEIDTYSEEGNIILTTFCSDNYSTVTEFKYDENNNLIYEATYSQDGALLSEYSYKYWEFNKLLEWSNNNYAEDEDIEYLGYWKYNTDVINLEIFLGQNDLCWIKLCNPKTNEVLETLSTFSFAENLSDLKELNIDFEKMTPTNNTLTLHKMGAKNKLNVMFQGKTIVLEKEKEKEEEKNCVPIILIVASIILIGYIVIMYISKRISNKEKTVLDSKQNWKCPNCEKEVYRNQERCENCGQEFDWSKL